MEPKTLIIIYILILVITIILAITKRTHWASIIGVAIFPIYFIWVLIDLGQSSTKEDKKQKVVDVMVGICVHNPDIFLEPPSNVKDTANNSLIENIQGASLSSDAKTTYLITQGAMSFTESEQQVKNDLPEQMNQFMKKNGFEPDEYEIQFFSEKLREDIKVLWAIAIRKT